MMKEKIRSYDFWVSMIGGILIVVKLLFDRFDLPFAQEILTGFLGVMCAAGMIKKPSHANDAVTKEKPNAATADSSLDSERAESKRDDSDKLGL